MKRYLSTAQVADYLGVTRDALNARIRTGDFVEPDVLIGDRFQGWSTDTVEVARQKEKNGGTLRCDRVQAPLVITTIRQVAELVRAYGATPYSADGRPRIDASVPATLHVLAARLENELRAMTGWDYDAERSVELLRVDGVLNKLNPEFLTETTVLIEFGQVHCLIRPVNTDAAAAADRLTLAAHKLDDLIGALPAVLVSPGTRLVMQALGAERDKINDHVQQLRAGLRAADR